MHAILIDVTGVLVLRNQSFVASCFSYLACGSRFVTPLVGIHDCEFAGRYCTDVYRVWMNILCESSCSMHVSDVEGLPTVVGVNTPNSNHLQYLNMEPATYSIIYPLNPLMQYNVNININ